MYYRQKIHFAKEISNFKNQNYVMASFDIVSLFTNIPVEETCSIIKKELFTPNGTNFNINEIRTQHIYKWVYTFDILLIFRWPHAPQGRADLGKRLRLLWASQETILLVWACCNLHPMRRIFGVCGWRIWYVPAMHRLYSTGDEKEADLNE